MLRHIRVLFATGLAQPGLIDAVGGVGGLGTLASNPAMGGALGAVEGKVKSWAGLSTGDKQIPAPRLPELKPFNISMISNPGGGATTRTDASKVLQQLQKMQEAEDSGMDLSKVKLSDPSALEQLKTSMKSAENLLSKVDAELNVVESRVANVEEHQAQIQASNTDPGVVIKLTDSGRAVKLTGSSNTQPPDLAYRIVPEDLPVPIVYTQPTVKEMVRGLLEELKANALASITESFSALDELFRGGATKDVVIEKVGLYQSWLKSQKEFIESQTAALSKSLVSGKNP